MTRCDKTGHFGWKYWANQRDIECILWQTCKNLKTCLREPKHFRCVIFDVLMEWNCISHSSISHIYLVARVDPRPINLSHLLFVCVCVLIDGHRIRYLAWWNALVLSDMHSNFFGPQFENWWWQQRHYRLPIDQTLNI